MFGVSVTCLVMFLCVLVSYQLFMGIGFTVSGGVGVHLSSFYGFSRMVSCVGHFGNVILGWVSGCVGAFVSRSTMVLEGVV